MQSLASDPQSTSLISALIIDDNAFDRRRLSRIATSTSLDFYLKEASDVQEFGQMLDQDKFDVIFVDLNLAGESGLKLLPGVRAHPVNKNAAMIMIAGAEQAEAALEALRTGFADYIEKSALSPASLERATLNALQKRSLTNQARVAKAESQSIEAVLKSFATACSQEMRPMMARMVRQVRQLKSELQDPHTPSMVSIENTCARMEEFLEDLGSLAGEGKLSSVVDEKVMQKFGTQGSAPAPAGSNDKVAPRPARSRH